RLSGPAPVRATTGRNGLGAAVLACRRLRARGAAIAPVADDRTRALEPRHLGRVPLADAPDRRLFGDLGSQALKEGLSPRPAAEDRLDGRSPGHRAVVPCHRQEIGGGADAEPAELPHPLVRRAAVAAVAAVADVAEGG